MAFSLTALAIRDKNIRYIYSGMPAQVSHRRLTEYPNMDQLRRKRENQQLKDYVLRTSECQSDYQCLIPRAPAFRVLSRHKVDEIVRRLGRPIDASNPRQDSNSERKAIEQEKTHRKYLGLRKVSREEMDEITKRVCQPTKMSMMRERQPQHLSIMP